MSADLVVVAAHGEQHRGNWCSYAPKHRVLILGDNHVPYRGYDSGKYLWAYWNYWADKYLFLQDSLIPHSPDFADAFFSKMPPFGAVAWAGFPFPMWDSNGQRDSAIYALGDVRPPKGIFGPIFAATREALDALRDNGCLPSFPLHKEAAQGKEREWAMAFEKCGIPIHFMHDYDMGALSSGACTPFTKVFAGRR